jgi:hypothetical protein
VIPGPSKRVSNVCPARDSASKNLLFELFFASAGIRHSSHSSGIGPAAKQHQQSKQMRFPDSPTLEHILIPHPSPTTSRRRQSCDSASRFNVRCPAPPPHLAGPHHIGLARLSICNNAGVPAYFSDAGWLGPWLASSGVAEMVLVPALLPVVAQGLRSSRRFWVNSGTGCSAGPNQRATAPI